MGYQLASISMNDPYMSYFISHSNAAIQYNKKTVKIQQDTVKTENIKINVKICTYNLIQDTVNSEQYNQWTKNSLVNGMSFNSPLTNFKRFFSIKSRTWSRPKKGKGKGKYLYSALLVVPHTQGAQAWITQCYLQLHQCLPLPRKRSSDCASPGSPDWGCAYLIAAYYSFIYPKRMKGWVGLVGWPTADGLST